MDWGGGVEIYVIFFTSLIHRFVGITDGTLIPDLKKNDKKKSPVSMIHVLEFCSPTGHFLEK